MAILRTFWLGVCLCCLSSLIFPAQAQQGKEIVEQFEKRWAGKTPPKVANPRMEEPADSIHTGVSTSLEEDLMVGPDDSPPKPPTSLEALKARFDPLRIDSLNDPKLLALSVPEIKQRIADLDSLKPEAAEAYSYALAYYAQEDKMAIVEEVNYGIRRSRALLVNYLQIEEEKKSRDILQTLDSLKIEEVYDMDKKTFLRPEWLDELKARIFTSGRLPDIQTHAIGHLMPNAKDFGLAPRQSASGYRLPLDENHNLLIIRLSRDGVKAVIWHNTKIWGSSRIVDVY
ncbi:MAG: hypothetical protein ACFCUI_01975 [Bernardetiaceae bacterium]